MVVSGQKRVDGLSEVWGCKSERVAITFTNQAVEMGASRRVRLCQAMQSSAEGESFIIDKETSTCMGGSWHCGFVEHPSGRSHRTLQTFLTKGEKLTHSVISFHRMQALAAPPPFDVADFMLMSPMQSAPVRPDLVR